MRLSDLKLRGMCDGWKSATDVEVQVSLDSNLLLSVTVLIVISVLPA